MSTNLEKNIENNRKARADQDGKNECVANIHVTNKIPTP